jgi:hypothetical protein
VYRIRTIITLEWLENFLAILAFSCSYCGIFISSNPLVLVW